LSHLLPGFAYHAGLKGLPVLLLTLCTIGWYALSLAPVTWILIRNFSQPHPRAGHFYFCVGTLERFIPSDVYLPYP
jgi:hypothetical protein